MHISEFYRHDSMAQIYYVDAQLGSDSNNGTNPHEAWQSLENVNTIVFQPGDSILFKTDCEWFGHLHPHGSGTVNKRIKIGSYGTGSRPAIHGSGVEAVILLVNQEYWEISHLEITNKNPEGDVQGPRRGIDIQNVNYGNDTNQVTNLDTITKLHDFYIHDMYIHDIQGEDKKDADGSAGIQFSVLIPNISEGIPAEHSVNQRSTFDGIRIENNELRNIDRSGIIFWTDWKSRDLLRHADFLYGDKTKTPWTPILNTYIARNKLFNIGGDGIAPHMTESAVIEYNFIDGYNTTSEGFNAGMWVWNSDNALFQYNEATGGISIRDGMPWDFDQANKGTIYQYNYSYGNEGGTLLICPENEGNGIVDCIFRYNLSYNDLYQTFTIGVGDTAQNIQVHNNVFYLDETMNTNHMVAQGGNNHAEIFNNIFVNYGTGTYTKKDKWQYRHNLYVGHNVPDYETIPDVQPLYSDPQFVNTDFPGTILNKDMETRDVTDWSALNGFQVLMTSPAIDAGVPVSKDSLDFYKNKSGHYANIGLDQKTR